MEMNQNVIGIITSIVCRLQLVSLQSRLVIKRHQETRRRSERTVPGWAGAERSFPPGGCRGGARCPSGVCMGCWWVDGPGHHSDGTGTVGKLPCRDKSHESRAIASQRVNQDLSVPRLKRDSSVFPSNEGNGNCFPNPFDKSKQNLEMVLNWRVTFCISTCSAHPEFAC